MARSVNQYFRSPKCLLAVVAVRTMETRRACSARLCVWRISSRISSAEDTARITSNRAERKISRARIDTCDIELIPGFYLPPLAPRQASRTGPRQGSRNEQTLRPGDVALAGVLPILRITLCHAFLQPTNGVKPARTLKWQDIGMYDPRHFLVAGTVGGDHEYPNLSASPRPCRLPDRTRLDPANAGRFLQASVDRGSMRAASCDGRHGRSSAHL